MASGPNPDGRSRFAKLGMAINEVLTRACRDILEIEVPHSLVYNKVRASPIFSKLRNDQVLLLKNAKSSGYADFDITLLYTLLRNICSKIDRPTKNWGGDILPAAGDETVGDDIERIRLIRNQAYGHANSASTSQAEFNDTWSLISDVCRRLQSHCGKNYMQNLENVKAQRLEEEHEGIVIEKIKIECEKDKSILERVTSLTTAVQELKVALDSEKKIKENPCKCYMIDIQANESSKQKDVDKYAEMMKDMLTSMIEAIIETSTENDIYALQNSFETYIQEVSCDNKESVFPLLGEMKKKIQWFAKIRPKSQMTVLTSFFNFLVELKTKYNVDSVQCKSGSVLLEITFETDAGYRKFLDDAEKGIVDQRLISVFVDLNLLSTVGLTREEISIFVTDITNEVSKKGLKHSAKRKQKQSSVVLYKRLKTEDLPDTPGTSADENFTQIKSDSTGRTVKRILQLESSVSIKVPRVDEYLWAEERDSDYEGLDEPPIRRQLQNILKQYPDGPQIIRELVQNAEDAEANAFKVVLFAEDNLGHGDFHPLYRKFFQGPALCAFNDSVFSETDWKGIKKIYTSVKENDSLKIGRFGLGFKSVFHLTDTPIIVSGDRLLVINPTRTTEKVCHNVTFKKLTSKYKESLWPILKRVFRMDAEGVFGFDTSSVEKENYPNTLFWFPLRQEPSSLLDKVCPPSKIENLMKSFRKEADTILLFLQNINKITIMENKDIILYEVTIKEIKGTSKQEFSKSRTFIRDQLKSLQTKPGSSLSVAYNAQLITTNVKKGRQKTARFKIVSLFQGTTEMSQGLRELSEEGDNVPFVGVAYPLQWEESFNAHVFCFLPLPLQSKSLTNLPIHVNGFFNLDQTRDHVLQATEGQVGQKDDRIAWNELLITEVVSQAYVKLFEDLIREDRPAEDIYRCLPEVEKVDSELWRKLLPPVFKHVLKMKIFQTERQKKTWVCFENAVFDVFDKEGEITREIEEQVIELIKDYDESIVLLPKNLKSLVESWKMYNYLPEVQPKVISTRYVAGLLHKDPQYKQKSRESKIVLLDYFLRCADPKDFRELELLPSDDKTHFLSFVSEGPLYLCSDKRIATLFPKLEKQFLSDLSKDMTTRLLGIPNTLKGFVVMVQSETGFLQRSEERYFLHGHCQSQREREFSEDYRYNDIQTKIQKIVR